MAVAVAWAGRLVAVRCVRSIPVRAALQVVPAGRRNWVRAILLQRHVRRHGSGGPEVEGAEGAAAAGVSRWQRLLLAAARGGDEGGGGRRVNATVRLFECSTTLRLLYEGEILRHLIDALLLLRCPRDSERGMTRFGCSSCPHCSTMGRPAFCQALVPPRTCLTFL